MCLYLQANSASLSRLDHNAIELSFSHFVRLAEWFVRIFQHGVKKFRTNTTRTIVVRRRAAFVSAVRVSTPNSRRVIKRAAGSYGINNNIIAAVFRLN